MKILILEDSEERTDLFKKEFEGLGELIITDNPKEALKKFYEEKPEFIFLDHDLNKFEGTEFTKELREDRFDRTNHFFIIHSNNPLGANRMKDQLRDIGCSSNILPFSIQNIRTMKEWILQELRR